MSRVAPYPDRVMRVRWSQLRLAVQELCADGQPPRELRVSGERLALLRPRLTYAGPEEQATETYRMGSSRVLVVLDRDLVGDVVEVR